MLEELISRRYDEYLLDDYVKYCSDLRNEIKNTPNLDVQIKKFFEKQFVDEMEPLSIIAQHFCGKTRADVKVQYQKKDPPDGKIFIPENAEICVEFTSARDSYLEHIVLERNRQGKITSTTGHTSKDFSGCKRAGFELEDEEESVNCDEIEETVQKQKHLIIDRINKKLEQPWVKRHNWLCVLIPDTEPPTSLYDVKITYCKLLRSNLDEIFNSFQTQLQTQHIEVLYFIGYEFWISSYAIPPVDYSYL